MSILRRQSNGDDSSVVQLFQRTGKPIKIQNVDVMKEVYERI